MPTPQISSHSHGREEITNEDRLPSERMQHWLREHHVFSQEPDFKEDKEEQHTKAEIGIVLCQAQEPRGKNTNEHERKPVYTGEFSHNSQRTLHMCRLNQAPTTCEKRCTEHLRCIKRMSIKHVEDQEPEGNGRSTTYSGNNPFLVRLERC